MYVHSQEYDGTNQVKDNISKVITIWEGVSGQHLIWLVDLQLVDIS
jgi:hypothetical protein